MAARVDIFPTYSEIRGGSYIPWKEIDRMCSYFVDGAQFAPSFQNKKWDGVKHLYHNGRVPTGLISKVLLFLESKAIPVEIVDHCVYPEKKYPWFLADDVTFREEHINAISAIMQGRRGMSQLPTRFGKTTVVASGTICGFGVPTLFIAHQLDLVYDAKKIFERFIPDCGEIGVIADGQCVYKPITVACIDSLANLIENPKMLKYLHDHVKYLIVDETQFFGSEEYKKVVYQCDAPYRLFMSATCERNDGADIEIEAASGPMLFELNEQDMIAAGYISNVEIEMIPFSHGLFNKKQSGLVYADFYAAALVENVKRNQLIVDEVVQLVNSGNPTIVIVKAIAHGHLLKQMLVASGITKTEFIWGDIPTKQRIVLREKFNAGEYDVLIGSTVFDVAIDLRRASGLVLAAGGSSKIRAPQRVGRVLSQVMGKTAIVKDIRDADVKWFEDDARDRQRVYVERYGQNRVKVRGVGAVSEIEKLIGISSSKMFDNLGL